MKIKDPEIQVIPKQLCSWAHYQYPDLISAFPIITDVYVYRGKKFFLIKRGSEYSAYDYRCSVRIGVEGRSIAKTIQSTKDRIDEKFHLYEEAVLKSYGVITINLFNYGLL